MMMEEKCFMLAHPFAAVKFLSMCGKATTQCLRREHSIFMMELINQAERERISKNVTHAGAVS
jgi:hypothetical protein